jgi:hypothetical protein
MVVFLGGAQAWPCTGVPLSSPPRYNVGIVNAADAIGRQIGNSPIVGRLESAPRRPPDPARHGAQRAVQQRSVDAQLAALSSVRPQPSRARIDPAVKDRIALLVLAASVLRMNSRSFVASVWLIFNSATGFGKGSAARMAI